MIRHGTAGGARAFLALGLAVATFAAPMEGLQPDHECPVASRHGAPDQGAADAQASHNTHHSTSDAPNSPEECNCATPGCCPPAVAALPPAAVASLDDCAPLGISAAPVSLARALRHLQGGTPAARAPPVSF